MHKRMNNLLAAADVCVKCGLCLPYCPTYLQTQNENESPRGRIALIQAYASSSLPASDKLLEHIDNCLLCRACESMCPAMIPYGRLLDDFRSLHYEKKTSSLATVLLKNIAHHKTTRQLTQSVFRFYQHSTLQKTARFLHIPKLLGLAAIDRLLPDTQYSEEHRLQTWYSATTTSTAKGTVGLFTACMSELLDRETLDAAIKVLTVAGFNVYVPKAQACCGALAAHEGDSETARHLAQNNVQAFEQQDLQAIVTIASGCGAHLQEYTQTAFGEKIVDISAFLTAHADLSPQLNPLSRSVYVHTPCSLKNVMRTENKVLTLLQQIPELSLIFLPEQVSCCGSAGSYVLEHPVMAAALLNNLLERVLTIPADYLVSSNIGCALHISAGLRERGVSMEVLHPVVLLARQLK